MPRIEEKDSKFEEKTNDAIRGCSGSYNLCNARRVQYSKVTITNIVDGSDTSKLSKALKSSLQDSRIGAIKGEIDAITTNRT